MGLLDKLTGGSKDSLRNYEMHVFEDGGDEIAPQDVTAMDDARSVKFEFDDGSKSIEVRRRFSGAWMCLEACAGECRHERAAKELLAEWAERNA